MRVCDVARVVEVMESEDEVVMQEKGIGNVREPPPQTLHPFW